MNARVADHGVRTRRIAVIGGGPSGLVTLKTLKDAGHEVVVFEKRACLGGTFTDAYDGMLLTTSNLLTSFSTFVGGDPSRPVLWQRDEYLRYLADYAARYDLLRHVRFGTGVRSVRRGGLGARWRLRLDPAKAGDGAGEEMEFDHVVICCGSNLRPRLPAWAEGSAFRGRLCHSSQVRSEREFAGRRVLVVGIGESGSDIALMAARNATAAALSSRTGPGYVIPRYYRGQPSDLDTNRCYHSLPRAVCGTPVVRFKTRIEDALLHPGEDRAVLARARELNLERGLSPFHRFGTKNASFAEAMVHHRMEYRPDVVRLEADRAVFADGSGFECDVVVCCTGFAPGFPFLEEHEPALARCGAAPRALYKRMIAPEEGTDIAWIGYVRPGIGSVQPCAEMQARYLAQLVSGERVLPPPEAMREDARMHAELDLRQFPVDAERVVTLTDYFRFMETMADVIGCRPPLRRLLAREPRTGLKVLFAPLSGVQYRLVGPGADPENARAVLRRMPTMPWPVLAYELLLLLGCRLAGLDRERWRTRRAGVGDGVME